MSAVETSFERREYKYLVPVDRVPALRASVEGICALDRFAGPDGRYPIRSLYFDSWDYELFWANEREQVDRVKVRVRSYPAAPKAPVFLEVKRRVNDVILKTRAALPADQWAEVVRDPDRFRALPADTPGLPYVERFVTLVHTYRLEPKVLVEYDRAAYVSPYESYGRVTFDYAVRCQRHDTLDMAADDVGWRGVDHPAQTFTNGPICVLELKFGTNAPSWMVALVRRFDLIRFAFSKYGYSIEHQLMLPELRQASRWVVD